MVETLKVNNGLVHICKDQSELADASARDFVRVMQEAVSKRGKATVALSGGHTPQILYDRVLQPDLKNSVDWSKVHFFVGDERTVPAESDQSNFGNAERLFLSKLNLPAGNLHPTKGQDLNPEKSAADYENEIRSFFQLKEGEFAQFDMIHLGMGPDGHCASLFPGTKALSEEKRMVVANHVDKLNTDRITFTFRMINSSHNVMFMLEGAEKSAVLAEALQSTTQAYPVQKIKPENGRLDWFIDQSAAKDLKVPR
jgi:6-phosphogluconolactonase